MAQKESQQKVKEIQAQGVKPYGVASISSTF